MWNIKLKKNLKNLQTACSINLSRGYNIKGYERAGDEGCRDISEIAWRYLRELDLCMVK